MCRHQATDLPWVGVCRVAMSYRQAISVNFSTMQNTVPAWLSGPLMGSASTVKLQRGQLLFRSGLVVKDLHFLLSGEVHLVRVLPDDSMAVVRRAKPGEFVALSAMSDERHGCDARAVVASVVVQLPVPAFRAALRRDGDLSGTLVTMLARALERQDGRLERLRLKYARDRVLHYLVCEGPTQLTHGRVTTLADELGMAAETLTRVLAKLSATGVVLRAGRRLELAGSRPSQERTQLVAGPAG